MKSSGTSFGGITSLLLIFGMASLEIAWTFLEVLDQSFLEFSGQQ